MSQCKLSDFTDFKQLGKGGFGFVYLARRTTDNTFACIKTISLKKGSSDKHSLEEAKTLSKLDHVNIIKYYDSFTAETELAGKVLCIVMEYAENGSLEDQIKVFPHQSLSFEIVL